MAANSTVQAHRYQHCNRDRVCGIQAHKLANMAVNFFAALAAMALLLAPSTFAKQCGTNKKAVCGALTCSI